MLAASWGNIGFMHGESSFRTLSAIAWAFAVPGVTCLPNFVEPEEGSASEKMHKEKVFRPGIVQGKENRTCLAPKV